MQPNLLLLNKPYGVLSQFSRTNEHTPTLADYIDLKGFYPAGRLDKDSEGLLLLTNEGPLQARISQPGFKMQKHYWVLVENQVTDENLRNLTEGVTLKDGPAIALEADIIEAPLPARDPPVRYRRYIKDTWLNIVINEGRNRQIRRMTAAIGHPTLRLYRHQIGAWSTEGIPVGEFRSQIAELPADPPSEQNRKYRKTGKGTTKPSRLGHRNNPRGIS